MLIKDGTEFYCVVSVYAGSGHVDVTQQEPIGDPTQIFIRGLTETE